MSGLGTSVCRAWTAFYTRGVPAEAAERRRSEIESDLWEHAAETNAARSHELQVIGRVLSGIPADLLWRRETRSYARPVPGGLTMSTRKQSIFSTVLVVAVAIAIGISVSVIAHLATSFDDRGTVAWASLVLALAAALVVGLALRASRPTLSTTLLLVGALAPSVAWFWLPPVYLVSVAIVVSALATTPRVRVEEAH